MSEHVWQWGDWGRTKNGTIVRFISVWDGGEIFLNGVNGSVICLRDVEYLPDCTGFAWKPIEPPEGYRILGRKELVQAGDKYKVDWKDQWFDATVFGDTVEKLKAASTVAYARKIEPIAPPEGYRMLLPNEQVLVGDKYLPDGDVAHWATICFGENAQRIAKAYARKIEPQYRPFRDGDEFEPHADRWVWCKYAKKQRAKVQNYNSESVLFGGNEYFKTYEKAFWEMEFLGGEPFGVENK